MTESFTRFLSQRAVSSLCQLTTLDREPRFGAPCMKFLPTGLAERPRRGYLFQGRSAAPSPPLPEQPGNQCHNIPSLQ